MELRGITIQYAKRKTRKPREYLESFIEQRLAEMEAFTPVLRLKKELQFLYEKRGEGAMFRSKLRWTEQGKKPTRYFFNMEAKSFNQKTILLNWKLVRGVK